MHALVPGGISTILALCLLIAPPNQRRSVEASVGHQQTFEAKGNALPVFSVIIDKSDYELSVFDEEGWLATYPVVFGSKNQGDKRMEGDRLTPNGHFRITYKKPHKEWGFFLLLDYPNSESQSRFKQRKTTGQIPRHAKIGGGIGIHGTRPHEEYAVDKLMNWTNGCISVKYSDIAELYNLLPLGTPVEIRE